MILLGTSNVTRPVVALMARDSFFSSPPIVPPVCNMRDKHAIKYGNYRKLPNRRSAKVP